MPQLLRGWWSWSIVVVVAGFGGWGCASAELPAAGQPAEPIGELLGRIEARTHAIDTLEAGLRYTVIQGLLGDKQVRFGRLWYAAPAADQPNDAEKLAVQLQREQTAADARPRPADQWLIFDGDWFLDRDHRRKTATRRGLRPLDAPADDAGASLPVPIRLNRADLEATYAIERVAADALPEDAPAGLAFTFTPKPGIEGEPIFMVFDAETLLPLELRFGDPEGDLTLFRLFDHAVNPGPFDADRFDTALPVGPGWDTQTVSFGE